MAPERDREPGGSGIIEVNDPHGIHMIVFCVIVVMMLIIVRYSE